MHTRLGLVFGMLVLIIFLVSGLGVSQIGALKNTTHQIATVDLERSLSAQRWANYIGLNWVRAEATLRSTDPLYIEFLQKQMAETSNLISEDEKYLKSSMTDASSLGLMGNASAARTLYVNARANLIQRRKNKESINDAVDNELRPLANAYIKAVNEVAGHEAKALIQTQTHAESKANTSQFVLLVCCAISVLIAVLLSYLITRAIAKPLSEAEAFTSLISTGDLTGSIDVRSGDEIGGLMQSLINMNQSLKKFVGNVRGSADSISIASKELSLGNADLSQRTEEQASSLEETASTMEEITSAVKKNAESAKHAKRLAVDSSEVAVKGGKLTLQVVQTMNGISNSSKKAADIITVIDGIAFQTNILALNAAVEAARAGEHGRGFAVVASEVRGLAQRSAAAAKEIKVLVLDSIQRAGEGSDLVSQAGRTMDDIVHSAKQVVDIMSEISAASQEQSNGIEQINAAINQIDQVTQQNASLVEQAAAAAESMEEQAHALSEAVSVFKIESSSSASKPKVIATYEERSDILDSHAEEFHEEKSERSAFVPVGNQSIVKGSLLSKMDLETADSADEWKRF